MPETNRIEYKRELSEGFSFPRNKELMRVYKDLDLAEQLGSGIPRILEHYDKDCFHFSDNFLRMVLPSAESVYATEQVPTKYPASIPQVSPKSPRKTPSILTSKSPSKSKIYYRLWIKRIVEKN